MPASLIRPAWLLIVLIAALAVEGLWRQVPAPRGVDAPAQDFSAARALSHIERIAQSPRPAGTDANRRARKYLVDELTALGLTPTTQPADVIRQSTFGGRDVVLLGHVTNVLARIEGADAAAGSIVLMAHFDSRPLALGAADDGAGTASLLETARAILAGARPRNTIIFLFTDGEEAGLLGARAFFEQHRWAEAADLVLNFEARGSSGAAKMFQTSTPNADLVELYKNAVSRPHANSLMGGVYRVMPNDTDLTPALAAGKAGLNFAFIDNVFDYHSMTDSIDNLAPDALQHLGETALAMTRAAGQADRPLEQSGSRVYFDILGLLLVDYPIWLGWVLAVAALAALVLLIVRLRASGRLPWPELGRGFAAGLVLFLAIGLLLDALSGLLTIDLAPRLAQWGRKADLDLHLAVFALSALAALIFALRIISDGIGRKRWAWILGGLGILVLVGGLLPGVGGPGDRFFSFIAAGHLVRLALVALLCLLVLDRPVGLWGLWTGAMVFLAVIGAIVQIGLPEASFSVVLPLLLGVAAAHWIVLRGGSTEETANLVIAGGLTFPALVWSVHLGALLYLGLAYAIPGLLVIPLLIAMVPMLPLLIHLSAPLGRAVPAGTALTAAVIGVGALVISPFDARHPRPTELAYLADARSGESFWATSLDRRDPWLASVMENGEIVQVMDDFVPFLSAPYYGVPAPSAAVRPPMIAWSPDAKDGPQVLSIEPAAGTEGIYLFVKTDVPVEKAVLNGHDLIPPSAPDQWWSILITALPEGALTLALTGAGGDLSVQMRYVQIRSGYPRTVAGDIPDRPANLMALPYSRSDQTVVIGEFTGP